MAHLVERMFAVGSRTWHGNETLLTEAPTTAAGIKLAGLDWHVSTLPLYLESGAPVPSARAVVRDDTGAVLAVMGSDWTPVQNVEAFQFFDPMLAGGFAKLETAGSLAEGRKVWVLARIGSGDVAGDQIDQFLLLANSHDGTLAVRVGLTAVRVVCNNTLSVALGRGRSMLRMTHTKNVHKALDDAKAEYARVTELFGTTMEQYQTLANTPIKSLASLKEYISRVFQLDAKAKAKAQAKAEKIAAKQRREDDFAALLAGPGFKPESGPARYVGPAVEPETDDGGRLMRAVLAQFEGGVGQDTPAARTTMWGAYNAVTGYLTHHKGRTEDNRRASNWWGTGATENQRALEVALDMAANR